MKKVKKYLSILLLVFCSIFASSICTYAAEDSDTEKVIRNGIYIEDIEVSGMTAEQAAQAIQDKIAKLGGAVMTLQVKDQTATATVAEFGLSFSNPEVIAQALNLGREGNLVQRYKVLKNLESNPVTLHLNYTIDDEMTRAVIGNYCVPFEKDTVNGTLTRGSNGFDITPGIEGLAVNVDESLELIRTYLTTQWEGGDSSIEVSTTILTPLGTEEELLKVQNVIGYAKTDYTGSSVARATNIKVGTQKVSGHLLYPGEAFSVTEVAVPFTAENGYDKAPSYEAGSIVDSYGGGICQVSTTLYQAVLQAELQVDERYNHSMIVDYVKPSMDAAIAEGSKDFIFTNSTSAPIYIEGYADGSTLEFCIYGQEYRDSSVRQIAYESVTTYEEDAPAAELTASTTAAAGSIEHTQAAHKGTTAELWKIITENGIETREKVNTSYYNSSPDKYTIGVKSDDAALTSKLYSAIATGDITKVQEALGMAVAPTPTPTPAGN